MCRLVANLSLPHAPAPLVKSKKPSIGQSLLLSGETAQPPGSEQVSPVLQPKWGVPASGHLIKDTFFSLPSGLTADWIQLPCCLKPENSGLCSLSSQLFPASRPREECLGALQQWPGNTGGQPQGTPHHHLKQKGQGLAAQEETNLTFVSWDSCTQHTA